MKKFLTLCVVVLLCCTCAFTALAAGRTQNRYASSYNPSLFNGGFFQYRMNCYGYTLQVFYQGDVSAGASYLQQPGEFAASTGNFLTLLNGYSNALENGTFYTYVKNCLIADMNELGYSITETTAAAAVPEGKRKIALAVGYDVGDYHFYMRHSNGKWSHKRGNTAIRDRSIDTNVTITDSNISTVAKEGGYDDGLGFFLIGKDAVTDYPHNDGHVSTKTKTPTAFMDRAGDSIAACTKIGGNISARFDYPNDRDWYWFVPTQTATYVISVSAAGTYNIKGNVWDDTGMIAADPNNGKPVFTLTLTAGKNYYINFYEANYETANYTLLCYNSSPTMP